MLDSLHSNTKIFLVDQETFLIIGKVETVSIANALCKGLINTEVMIVNIELEYDDNKNYHLIQHPTIHTGLYGSANAAKIVYDLSKLKKYDIRLSADELSNNFLQKRNLFNIRKKGIEILEQNCHRYSARLVNSFEDGIFLQYISKELDRSFPELGQYSDGILNWARLSNTTPDAAYQQLKLEYSSASINILKLHAIWNKYVFKINLLDNLKDIIVCLQYDFETEMFLTYDLR
jgi:hypothetical protein